MGKGSDSPPQVNQGALINAQTRANRINQVTPFGSIVYGQNPETGRETQIMQFAPEVQSLINSRVGDIPSGPLDFNADEQRSRVENAIFSRAQGLLDPVFARQEETLRDRLANAGQLGNQFINPGGRQDLEIFNRGRSEAYENAALDAVAQGENVLGNAFNRAVTERALPYNELAAILQSMRIAAPNVPAIDVLGPAQLQYGGQMADWQNEQANQRGLMSGLFGLGSTALSVYGGGGGAAGGGGFLGDLFGGGGAAGGGAGAAAGGAAALGAAPALGAGTGALGGTAIGGAGTAAGAGAAGAGTAGAGAGLGTVGLAALPAALAYGAHVAFGDDEEENRREAIELRNFINQRVTDDPDSLFTPAAENKPASFYNVGGMQAPMSVALAQGNQPSYVPGVSPDVQNALQERLPQAQKLQLLNDALFNLEFGPNTNAAQVFEAYKQRGLFTDEDREIFRRAGYSLTPGFAANPAAGPGA